jgi:hypothetical protein
MSQELPSSTFSAVERLPDRIIIGIQVALADRWVGLHPEESEEGWYIRYPIFFRQMCKNTEDPAVRPLLLKAVHDGFSSEDMGSIQDRLDQAYSAFCSSWGTVEGRKYFLEVLGKGLSDKWLNTLEHDLDAAYARASGGGNRAQAA